MIFLDTSGVYALADVDDDNHERAVRALDIALRNGEELLAHSYILVESAALLHKRLGLKSALEFLRDAQSFRITWVSPELHHEAVAVLEKSRRSKISLVDAVSFLVMREEKAEQYLGFDRHFADQGFRRAPGTP